MFNRILVYVDFSEISYKAFLYAHNLAQTRHAKLVILHVVRDMNYPQIWFYVPGNKLEEYIAFKKEEIYQKLANYMRKLGDFTDYEIVLKKGMVFQEIILVAKKESVDIIVIGIKKKKGMVDSLLDSFFGSNVEKVIKASACPVLIVGENFILS